MALLDQKGMGSTHVGEFNGNGALDPLFNIIIHRTDPDQVRLLLADFGLWSAR